jgi:hypothetical protein
MNFTKVLELLNEASESWIINKSVGFGKNLKYHFFDGDGFTNDLRKASRFSSEESAKSKIKEKYPNQIGTLHASKVTSFEGYK